jgi:hypothetical protein
MDEIVEFPQQAGVEGHADAHQFAHDLEGYSSGLAGARIEGRGADSPPFVKC